MNRGYIFIFLATVFFSSMEVALKTVAHDFNPMQLNCTRFLVGGLLLIPFALRGLRQHGARVTAAAWKGFAWLGFVGLVVSMMFYQMSILYAPASVVSVLFSCNPVLVLAFAYLILRADIRPQHITALVMEVAAALIIIDPLHTTLDPVGITLVLLSAATFALYAVLGKKQCTQYSGVAVTCFSCLAASAEMIVLMLISHIPAVADALQAAVCPCSPPCPSSAAIPRATSSTCSISAFSSPRAAMPATSWAWKPPPPCRARWSSSSSPCWRPSWPC